MNYTELHLHSHYSLLDGLNTPEEYLKRAAELDMTHMAVTDHGNLSAHREFQRAAKENGITPILGCEMYISASGRFDRRPVKKRDDNTQLYNHVIVLAQNETGLVNLNKMSEAAWREGFYYKPRIDMELLEEHNDGLIVLSGCLNGLISKAIVNEDTELAEQYTRDFKRIFGDRFFIEVQGHNPMELNQSLMGLAEAHKIKPVVTSDCHHARKEDMWIEDALLVLSTKPREAKGFDYTKSQKMGLMERINYLYPDRQMSFEKFELFLHSVEEHQAALAKHGIGDEPISNTMVVASMIGDYPYHEGLDLLPTLPDEDPAEKLERMAWEGLKERGLDHLPEYRARMREELDIIKPRFPMYFIITADTIQWALDEGIRVGPGRGSAAGSLLCYALRITHVDPIEHNLLFFRFVNPERNDYPDVDTDIMVSRRGEVKKYLNRKYTHTASIATFGTFQGKESVKSASRVFGVPLGEVNRAVKGADWVPPLDWWEEFERTEKGKDFCKKHPDVIKLAKYLYGRIRTQGVHAGGVVIANQPIAQFAPMQSGEDKDDAASPRVPVVAMDMEEAADVGFIKWDWLGLKALDIIDDTVKSVKARKGIDIDVYDIPLDDANVYSDLSQGYTSAVFQCEAPPYTNLLINMGGVRNFDELAASNALVRPGAMKSSAGQHFIDRKEGREMVEYAHPDMKWFTEETYGVVIYQEQVMLTMTELAGMSMADADKVRKIIGKKRDVSEFEAYKEQFIEGASEKISRGTAEALWHDFEAHAGYSFNKSHAVAYSLVSYWTAWLKQHHPLDFMMAVLKHEDDKDSRVDYLIETKRIGVRVVLPHVNASGVDFEIQTVGDEEVIRFGLKDIKFLSETQANKLIEYRPFASYAELEEAISEKNNGLTRRTLSAMNAVGAAAFADNPRTGNERENFYEYLAIPAFEPKGLPPVMKAQFRTLDEFSQNETFVTVAMVREVSTGPNWCRIGIVDETGSEGVFAPVNNSIETGQMYVLLIANNSIARYATVEELAMVEETFKPDPTLIDFYDFLGKVSFPDIEEGAVRIVAFNTRLTKKGDRMADVTFVDRDKDMMTALVWPSQWAEAFSKCRVGAEVTLTLKELDGGGYAINTIGKTVEYSR